MPIEGQESPAQSGVPELDQITHSIEDSKDKPGVKSASIRLDAMAGAFTFGNFKYSIEGLADVLAKNTTLETLTLSGARFTPALLLVVLQSLWGNTTLKSLTLNKVELTPEVIEVLGDWLKNRCGLQELVLTNHNGDSVPNMFKPLCEGIAQHTALQALNFSHTRATEDDWDLLVEALATHPGITCLDLGHPLFAPEDDASQMHKKLLDPLLRDNTTIRELNIDGWQLPVDFLQQMQQRLQRNRHSLVSLSCHDSTNFFSSDVVKTTVPNQFSRSWARLLTSLNVGQSHPFIADVDRVLDGSDMAVLGNVVENSALVIFTAWYRATQSLETLSLLQSSVQQVSTLLGVVYPAVNGNTQIDPTNGAKLNRFTQYVNEQIDRVSAHFKFRLHEQLSTLQKPAVTLRLSEAAPTFFDLETVTHHIAKIGALIEILSRESLDDQLCNELDARWKVLQMQFYLACSAETHTSLTNDAPDPSLLAALNLLAQTPNASPLYKELAGMLGSFFMQCLAEQAKVEEQTTEQAAELLTLRASALCFLNAANIDKSHQQELAIAVVAGKGLVQGNDVIAQALNCPVSGAYRLPAAQRPNRYELIDAVERSARFVESRVQRYHFYNLVTRLVLETKDESQRELLTTLVNAINGKDNSHWAPREIQRLFAMSEIKQFFEKGYGAALANEEIPMLTQLLWTATPDDEDTIHGEAARDFIHLERLLFPPPEAPKANPNPLSKESAEEYRFYEGQNVSLFVEEIYEELVSKIQLLSEQETTLPSERWLLRVDRLLCAAVGLHLQQDNALSGVASAMSNPSEQAALRAIGQMISNSVMQNSAKDQMIRYCLRQAKILEDKMPLDPKEYIDIYEGGFRSGDRDAMRARQKVYVEFAHSLLNPQTSQSLRDSVLMSFRSSEDVPNPTAVTPLPNEPFNAQRVRADIDQNFQRLFPQVAQRRVQAAKQELLTNLTDLLEKLKGQRAGVSMLTRFFKANTRQILAIGAVVDTIDNVENPKRFYDFERHVATLRGMPVLQRFVAEGKASWLLGTIVKTVGDFVGVLAERVEPLRPPAPPAKAAVETASAKEATHEATADEASEQTNRLQK